MPDLYDEEINEEDYPDFEALVEWIGTIPQPSMSVIVIENYKRMRHAFCHIRKAFASAGAVIHPKVEIDALFRHGSISIESEDISGVDILHFMIALADSDNFEIYPLANGNLRGERTA